MRLYLTVLSSLLIIAMALLATKAGGDERRQLDPIPPSLLARAAALRDQAIEQSKAYELLGSLTVEVGPRFAGSEGDRAGVAWALTRLRELGFSNVRAESVTVPQWERGELIVAITEPFPQQLVAVALGGSVGTDGNGLTAPVVGFENLEALQDAPDAEVEGHIVYVGDRMIRTQDGSGYSSAVKKRSKGPVIAARKGARALLIRSVGTSSARVGHTGWSEYQDGDPKIPALALANADADMLEAQLDSGHPVSVHLKLSARMLPPQRSANVLAEVPGGDSAEEIILLAAHLDSWDLGTGAIDDGAGVAIVMEAARLINALPQKPRRTIRLLLAANEEFGLSGAEAYAKEHGQDLANHVLGIEADFGAGRVYQLASRVAEDDLALVEEMTRVLAPLGITQGSNDAGGGADLSPMRKLGMPVLAPRQDGSKYFDYHHTADDTLDKIERTALDQNVAVYAALALLAADMPRRFVTREAEPPPAD